MSPLREMHRAGATGSHSSSRSFQSGPEGRGSVSESGPVDNVRNSGSARDRGTISIRISGRISDRGSAGSGSGFRLRDPRARPGTTADSAASAGPLAAAGTESASVNSFSDRGRGGPIDTAGFNAGCGSGSGSARARHCPLLSATKTIRNGRSCRQAEDWHPTWGALRLRVSGLGALTNPGNS